MDDTTATVRAEILEEEKRKIDEKIDNARELRDVCRYMSEAWNFWDDEIDRLLIEKDNLSLSVPSGWIENAEADAAEAKADAQERDELYQMGMGR